MIRSLTGVITNLSDNNIVIEVNNIGYLVNCSTLTNRFILNSTITLYTYLAVRENALDLYGFIEQSELVMFELLLEIPKVGPKSAMQIITHASPTLLTEATHKNDAVYLQKLSGLGKKTCENIVQFLQKKLDRLPKNIISEDNTLNQTQTDAIDTLIALGYDLTTARETILSISDNTATVNSLVSQALKQIN